MPKNARIGLYDFMDKFKTNEACREHLLKKRYPNGFVCPRCDYTKHSEIKPRGLYQCCECRYQVSVTAGTIMHKTHLPLTKWFLAMYLITTDKRGYSAKQLSNELNISYKTAWFLLHRLRTAMGERDSEYVLSGIVEFDDTYFGSGKGGGKRGRGTDKTSVVVAVSKTDDGKPQYLKMQVVPNIKGETIGEFATGNIAEKSEVQTDAYRSFRKPLAEDFDHIFEIYDPQSDWLRWLHTIIGNAKAFVLGTFHGLDKKYLQLYLDEFCYRFNRRFMRHHIFDRLVVASVHAPHLALAELK